MLCIFDLITGGDDEATPLEKAAENCPAGKGPVGSDCLIPGENH
jgi:hypothetical protein